MKLINQCLAAVLVLAASTTARVGNRKLVGDQPERIPRQYVITATATDAVEALILKHGATVMHKYEAIFTGVSATNVSPALLEALKNLPTVTSIDQDVSEKYDMLRGVRSFTTQAGVDPGLDRLDQTKLPLDGNFTYSGNGTGVKVFVMDSGIRLTHTEFQGRASCGFDATLGTPYQESEIPCDPVYGHGTHVAAIVGGAKSGVAKNVDLIAVKVATYVYLVRMEVCSPFAFLPHPAPCFFLNAF